MRTSNRAKLHLSPWLAYGLALVAFGVVAVFLLEALIAANTLNQAEARRSVDSELNRFRVRMESAINLNVNLARGLAVAVATEPNMDQARFSDLARAFFADSTHVRRISGAPGMVTSLIYRPSATRPRSAVTWPRTRPNARLRPWPGTWTGW